MSYQQPYMPSQYMPQQQSRRLNFVAGEEGMKSFYVGPGEVVALFDTEGPTMWIKWANEIGAPDSIAYTITEKPKEQPAQQADATAIRLDALEALVNEIKGMLSNAATIPDVRTTAAKPRHASGATGEEAGGR